VHVTSDLNPKLLDRIRAIAEAAGDCIMEVYDGDFDVELKDDSSPLTQADRAAHELIVERLGALPNALPVLSEESSGAEISDRLSWGRYWLVDPLDGTKEFIKRNGEFTVNIALVDDHRAVLGVVVAPAKNLVYTGLLGHGAFSIVDGAERPIRVTRPPADPLRVVGSRSHASPALAAYLDALGEHVLKPMGSSLKICLVAEGSADVYPRLGPTSEWDTAAAQAILESAGGSMMDTVGQPLRYNSKEFLLNPHFLAFGDVERDWLAPLRLS
jgi:3'(2'), 5'-bisphosphate nucleotidase